MEKSNKEIAVLFLNMVVAGKIREAFAAYTGEDFKHHNPYSKGDKESLVAGMTENEGQFPNKVFTVEHVIAEGDFVAMHSHLVLKSGELELATVHIARFNGNQKIVEFWDVAQPIQKDSPNENGMF